MNFFEELKNFDAEVANACDLELQRQRHNIELIASENIVSKAVLLAAGGVLTNKYAEGYPSKRYYGGCQCVDEVENLAIERVVRKVKEQKVTAITGKDIPIKADSVCVHGDGEKALAFVAKIRERLAEEGVEICSLDEIV